MTCRLIPILLTLLCTSGALAQGVNPVGLGGTGGGGSSGVIAAIFAGARGQSALDTAQDTETLNAGYAPVGVWFSAMDPAHPSDAPSISSEWGDCDFAWDYGDERSETWDSITGLTFGKSKNVEFGPNGTHVYEVAGTFTVTLDIRCAAGPDTATMTVVVDDPNVGLAGAGQTACISTAPGQFEGCVHDNDADADCDVNTADCFVATGDPAAILAARINTSDYKRVMFRAGDTWSSTCSGGYVATRNGPIVGPFGSGAKPILQCTDLDGGDSDVKFFFDVLDRFTLYGVELRSSLSSASKAGAAVGCADTNDRCDALLVHDVLLADDHFDFGFGMGNANSASGPANWPNYSVLSEVTGSKFLENSAFNPNFMKGACKYCGFLGLHYTTFAGTGMRFDDSEDILLANNHCDWNTTTTVQNGSCVNFRGADPDHSNGNGCSSHPYEHTMARISIVNNRIRQAMSHADGISIPSDCSATAQDGFEDVLIMGNFCDAPTLTDDIEVGPCFDSDQGPGGTTLSSGTNVFRGNIGMANLATGPFQNGWSLFSPRGTWRHINNDMVVNGTQSDKRFGIVRLFNENGANDTCRNNVVFTEDMNDAATEISRDNNCNVETDNVVVKSTGNNPFVGTIPSTTIQDFRGDDSQLLGQGANLLFRDFQGDLVPTPNDIGAVED